MKAVVQHEYGSPDVFDLREVDEPVVIDDDVLMRVHASSDTHSDWQWVTGSPLLVRLVRGWPHRSALSRAATWPDESRRSGTVHCQSASGW